jgi:ankyrin repeat protein
MGCGASSNSAYEVQTDGSALFKAMMAEDLEQLAAQLEAGADINPTNAAGLTLLQVACERGKNKSRRFLRTHGASRFEPVERARLHSLVNNESKLHDCYEFNRENEIGSGGYADVFRGVKKGPGEGEGRLVAIGLDCIVVSEIQPPNLCVNPV